MDKLFAFVLLAGCASHDNDAPRNPPPRDVTPAVIAGDQAGANDIAVDEQRVYWTNFTDDGALMSAPLAGGAPFTLAKNLPRPGRLCLDGDHVYWTNYSDGTVNRIAKSGGAATTIATGQRGPAACARGGDRLVWTNFVDDGAVMSLDLARGEPPVSLAAGQTRPNVVVLQGGAAYWILSDESAGAVVRMDASGAMSVLADREPNPFDIVVDDTHAYWTNRTGGTVRAVPLSGGPAVTLAGGQHEPIGIALDGDFVYWTNFRGGTVTRVALAGGEPTVLAERQGGPRRIAVDGTRIYWTNYESGTVMSMAKP